MTPHEIARRLRCCDDWEDAQRRGTDNEGYGSLIHVSPDGRSSMGSGLADIKFCPWCGASKAIVAAEKQRDA